MNEEMFKEQNNQEFTKRAMEREIEKAALTKKRKLLEEIRMKQKKVVVNHVTNNKVK